MDPLVVWILVAISSSGNPPVPSQRPISVWATEEGCGKAAEQALKEQKDAGYVTHNMYGCNKQPVRQ